MHELVLPIILTLVGCVVLGYGADWLVKGASQLARRLGVEPLVIGLTVVAFGTSAPELVTSLLGGATIATGNVVGSNLINLGLILGATAIVAPLVCRGQFVRFELPVMVAIGPLAWWMAADGELSRVEGIVMVVLLVIVMTISVIRGKSEKDPAVLAEMEDLVGDQPVSVGVGLLLIGAGLVGLVGGAHALVTGGKDIAQWFGVSERIIALTLVAGGTSLPELATSIVAAKKGEGDIALGNLVGSNIMNILMILGIVAVTSPIAVSPASITFDFPAMTIMQGLCVPIMLSRMRVSRIEGAALLFAYGVYCLVAFGGILS